jgi:SseB protein C-terminal domain/SseB protein N-terminal domain
MAFVPENALESALMHAAKDAAARPEFYRLLLESDLLVLGRVARATPGTDGPTVLPGDSLQIVSAEINGRTSHPVFSSTTRLQTYIREQQNFLTLKGRALFEATPGASFVLNPGSDYGKELPPTEIMRLLDPKATAPERVTLQKATSVRIGQPAVYPHALVDALKEAFAARDDVVAAYLIQIAYEGQPSHPLIGIETTSAWDAFSMAVGQIAAASAPGLVFDLAPIDRSGPQATLNSALLETTPFYQRKTSLWNSLFH